MVSVFILPVLGVGGGVMVISATNAIHGVLWLVATFLCGVALFVSQGMDYIAFIFLIIYVGAIAILFLFVTMMLNLVVRPTFDMSNGLFTGFVIGGVLYGTLLYLSSVNVVYSGAWDFTLHHNVKVLASVLYSDYAYGFIIASYVLLVAMVGVILLTFSGRPDYNLGGGVCYLGGPTLGHVIQWGDQLATYGVAAGCIDDSKVLIYKLRSHVLRLSPQEKYLAWQDVYHPQLPETFKFTCQKILFLSESVGVEEYTLSVAEFREERGDLETPGEVLNRYDEAEAAVAMQEANILTERAIKLGECPVLDGDDNCDLAGKITTDENASLVDCLEAMDCIKDVLGMLAGPDSPGPTLGGDDSTSLIDEQDAYDPRLPEALQSDCRAIEELSQSVGTEDYSLSTLGDDGYVDPGGIFQLPEFKPVLLVVCAAIVLAFVILAASLLLTKREPDLAKASVYECGFDPWGAPRVPFSVKFFLVGILFLIFDLEVSFLYPWAVCLGMMRHVAIGVVWGFLGILGLGLFYEWHRGGLEW